MSEYQSESSYDFTVMYDREEKELLISSLLEVDLVQVSKRLFANNIIFESTKNIFISLDYEYLDPKLCIRYLLQNVFESVKDVRVWETNKYDVSKWNRFVQVLINLGGKAKRVGMKLEAGTLLEVQDGQNDMTKHNLPLLKEKDVNKLMEVLYKYAYEWEVICIALNLPRYVMEECRKGSTDVIKLNDVLYKWIVGQHPDTKPATFLNLKWVLGGPIVGCGKAVSDLMYQFNEYDSQPEIFNSSRSSLTLLHPTTTTVRFGRSTLLEVQVSDSLQSVSYQWMRDGKKLYYNDGYEGMNNNILCILEATDSGNYSCIIKTDDDSVRSKEAYLEVIFPDRDDYLVSNYSQFPEIPKDTWPPVSTGAFISIALIEGKKTSFSHTISKCIDDILEEKEVIEYKKVFGTYTSGALLLVEGRPGSGKTTLVHKITRDWAKSYSVLNGASKVYLISLRLLNCTRKDKELFDILRLFYIDDDDTRAAFKQVKYCKGEGVCFILDGLDEYIGNNGENVIQELIYKRILPLAMVIVASRPVGTAVHRNNAKVSKRIEVLGFTRGNIDRYINNYPFGDDTNMASKLMAHLKLHTNTLHMCYLPVHASMVCYLYMNLEDEIPHTETKMYEYFTGLTIVRALRRDGKKHAKFISLDDLEGEIKENFEKICELAFNMTKNSEQVIPSKCKLNHALESDASSLGLLVIDSTIGLYGYKDVYTFLHLTFQEFLAAFYIKHLEDFEQLKIIEYLGHHKQYQVIKFYFGLVDTEKKLDQFKMFLNLVPPGNTYSFQCAFESRSHNACQEIFNDCNIINWNRETSKNILYLNSCYLMPSDFVAMGYVMSELPHHLSKIRFLNCYFDDEGIKAYLLTVNSYKLCFIKHLQFFFEGMQNRQLQLLIKGLSLFLTELRYLEELDLGRAILTDNDVRSLKGISLSNLKVLRISLSINQRDVLDILKFDSMHLHVYAGSEKDYGFSDCEHQNLTWSHLFHTFGKQLAPYSESDPYSESGPESIILCCLNLCEISFDKFLNCASYTLVDCGIDDEGISKMTKALISRSRKPFLLRFDVNKITGKGAVCLANLLRVLPEIKFFSAMCNNIDDIGAKALANSFKHCQQLIRIDLQCNAIGDEGAVALVEVTPHKKYTNIELNIWNKYITEDGITNALKCRDITTIKTVNFLKSQHIIQAYPQLLKKLMTYCYSLHELKVKNILEENNFNMISTVIEELKYFSKLLYLNFEDCLIGLTDAIALAGALKYLSKLKELNLKGNKFYSEGTLVIAGALKYCMNLEVLNMSFNMFSSLECIAALGDGLERNSCLVKLDLSLNMLSSIAGKVLNKSICSNLQNLNLAGCSIDSNGGISLAEKLKYCLSLQQLNLGGNDIGCGLVAIADNLRCPNLQVLCLTGVKINKNSAVALATTLMHCPVLEEIYLADNNFDTVSMKTLAEGLKFNSRLKNLYLDSNEIGSEGAASLSRCFNKWQNLLHLSLGHCQINSITAFADGLKHCNNLQTLDLDSNNIGTEGAIALANGLKYCCSLYRLLLTGNPIEDADAIELFQVLKHVKNIHISEDRFEEKTKMITRRLTQL